MKNKTHIANNGYTQFNEGYEKKGGVNTDKKTPRPQAPKPQATNKKTKQIICVIYIIVKVTNNNIIK